MITKLDPVNITRMVVSGIIAGVELGINYFAMHSGLQTPEFTALMVIISAFPYPNFQDKIRLQFEGALPLSYYQQVF